jgi:membrane protein DedA with SNARE-associated domain
MLFEQLSAVFTGLISSTGYLGVFVLMVLESMVAPVPSELVMPFAGFLVADGKMDLFIVILISSAASLTGSLVSYFAAYYGEKEMIHKFGKLFFLDRKELEWTEKWFKKHGDATVFVSRFVPVIRHLISLPAGLARMKLRHFVVSTLAGATLWNTFLLWAGIQLRERWDLVGKYSGQLDVIIIALILAGAAYAARKHFREHK